MAKKIKSPIGYIAVRWPAALRQILKVEAASADPPMTMTEFLQACFEYAIAHKAAFNVWIASRRKGNTKS